MSSASSSSEYGISESSVSMVGRPSKVSRVGQVARWICQVLGPLVALATLNVSLYVMLMLNDWTNL